MNMNLLFEFEDYQAETSAKLLYIRDAFNKFPDFFCTGIYNCCKLEIFQYVVTILLMR